MGPALYRRCAPPKWQQAGQGQVNSPNQQTWKYISQSTGVHYGPLAQTASPKDFLWLENGCKLRRKKMDPLLPTCETNISYIATTCGQKRIATYIEFVVNASGLQLNLGSFKGVPHSYQPAIPGNPYGNVTYLEPNWPLLLGNDIPFYASNLTTYGVIWLQGISYL